MVPTFNASPLARCPTVSNGISRTWLKNLAAAVSTATISGEINNPFAKTTSEAERPRGPLVFIIR